MDSREKLHWILNMLEDVPAAHQVTLTGHMLLAIEVLMIFDTAVPGRSDLLALITRIETNSGIPSLFTEQGKKMSLSTADFQDAFMGDSVGMNQATGELPSVFPEHR
jgi:hypothetical protein